MEKNHHVRRNGRRHRLVILFALLISTLTVQAQSLVKGTVTDASGTPLTKYNHKRRHRNRYGR